LPDFGNVENGKSRPPCNRGTIGIGGAATQEEPSRSTRLWLSSPDYLT
jgi:hypothetical protein